MKEKKESTSTDKAKENDSSAGKKSDGGEDK